jgi:hypothetical protein
MVMMKSALKMTRIEGPDEVITGGKVEPQNLHTKPPHAQQPKRKMDLFRYV